MAVMTNVGPVREVLRSRLRQLGSETRIEHSLEYVAPYAIIQHERLDFNHPGGGQAKYLEEPARKLRPQIPGMARKLIKEGYSLAQISFHLATIVKDASQPLVPVDTGDLKRSWRIRRTV